jgi:hypothetical protein
MLQCDIVTLMVRVNRSRQKSLIFAVILVVVLVVIAILVHHYWHHNSKTTAGHASATQTPRGPETGNSSASPSPASPVASAAATPTPRATLQAPTGDLLSKHTISLSSSDPTSNPDENSTCQTEAGASCQLRLNSSSGVVKTVGPMTAASGVANFNWNAKQAGLTPGNWTIVAIATFNGQSATSSPDSLTVNP